MPTLARRQLLAAAAASLAAPLARATGALPRMQPTFAEDFAGPVSFYDPATGKGRWKTNYWFGDQKDQSSRCLPGERQIYVDRAYCGIDPFAVGKGSLKIIAARNARPGDARLFDPYTGRTRPVPYTSGLITTEKSFQQRYGYFEASMAFPQVRGCWPAFWLLGPPGSPHAGDEIDAVEWVASNPKRLFFNAHLAGQAQATWADGFDTRRPNAYGVLWTKDSLAWFVNGDKVHERPNPGLHQPMYLLLNLAIGGWDNNLPEDPSGFPASLQISSVKAYRLT
jgi:beta-glucanase (GH16 family)